MKYLLPFLPIFLLILSCTSDPISPPVMEEPDCRYLLPTDNSSIIGAWETIEVRDAETGEITAAGDEYIGFMIESDRYCDAFELRPDEIFKLYYKRNGRPCKTLSNGGWQYKNDSIYFDFETEILKVEVLEFSETELIIKDIVDFKPAIAKMRRAKD